MLEDSLRGLHRKLGISPDYGQTTLLPPQQQPTNLVSIGLDIYGREQKMAAPAADSWHNMVAAARRDNVILLAVSAFRSITYQVEVIQRSLDKGELIEDILTRIAAPGFSEHHTGRAIDLTTTGFEAVEEAFEESEAFQWLCQEARVFQFTMSYPRDNHFGVIYEPWHWCYRP